MDSSCTTSSPSPLSALTAINVAMECNNVGCDLLATNDAASAIETFSLALKLMRTVSQARVEPHLHSGLAAMASQSHIEARRVVHQRSSASWFKKQCASSSSSALKLASRAIKMNFVCHPAAATHTPFLNDNSTILLYNMGLACLVHGTPLMLSKSLPLFDMAYKLGVDSAASPLCSGASHYDNGPSYCSSTLQRICMDSLHFSAQLYHSNSDFDMAEKTLVELRQLIVQLPPTHDPQEQNRRHHFWILKDVLQKPSLAPAA